MDRRRLSSSSPPSLLLLLPRLRSVSQGLGETAGAGQASTKWAAEAGSCTHWAQAPQQSNQYEGKRLPGVGRRSPGPWCQGITSAHISLYQSTCISQRRTMCESKSVSVCVWFCRRDLQSQHHLIKLCLRENEQKRSVKGLFPSSQFLFYCECTFPVTV